ncbi:maleylpyruvate isomerase family mycothiol-dependent enzyme [Streptomyces phyllanthi]|uniref:Maleylpyruvate isomerase family mycothiol-dependent enzyme n=1 Tax=Streptomyces phyllanthi TaxID=1803180 RepID=A0A5N8WJ88_9ACTN|nr:maleylpyruvate isomerase family mycothiol-dependent enzyme [Streptomyces phyllanthi]
MELTLTNEADLQPAVAAEFIALADLLGAASDAQWDTPTLCERWRVREVIAHLTMAARYSEEEFMADLRHCDFDFTLLSNHIASRDAELPTGELVANLRADVALRMNSSRVAADACDMAAWGTKPSDPWKAPPHMCRSTLTPVADKREA